MNDHRRSLSRGTSRSMSLATWLWCACRRARWWLKVLSLKEWAPVCLIVAALMVSPYYYSIGYFPVISIAALPYWATLAFLSGALVILASVAVLLGPAPLLIFASSSLPSPSTVPARVGRFFSLCALLLVPWGMVVACYAWPFKIGRTEGAVWGLVGACGVLLLTWLVRVGLELAALSKQIAVVTASARSGRGWRRLRCLRAWIVKYQAFAFVCWLPAGYFLVPVAFMAIWPAPEGARDSWELVAKWVVLGCANALLGLDRREDRKRGRMAATLGLILAVLISCVTWSGVSRSALTLLGIGYARDTVITLIDQNECRRVSAELGLLGRQVTCRSSGTAVPGAVLLSSLGEETVFRVCARDGAGEKTRGESKIFACPPFEKQASGPFIDVRVPSSAVRFSRYRCKQGSCPIENAGVGLASAQR